MGIFTALHIYTPLEGYVNNQRIGATTPTHSKLQIAILIAAIVYWPSPIDTLPFMPVDDLIVMALAYLNYTKNDGQEVQ